MIFGCVRGRRLLCPSLTIKTKSMQHHCYFIPHIFIMMPLMQKRKLQKTDRFRGCKTVFDKTNLFRGIGMNDNRLQSIIGFPHVRDNIVWMRIDVNKERE